MKETQTSINKIREILKTNIIKTIKSFAPFLKHLEEMANISMADVQNNICLIRSVTT